MVWRLRKVFNIFYRNTQREKTFFSSLAIYGRITRDMDLSILFEYNFFRFVFNVTVSEAYYMLKMIYRWLQYSSYETIKGKIYISNKIKNKAKIIPHTWYLFKKSKISETLRNYELTNICI